MLARRIRTDGFGIPAFRRAPPSRRPGRVHEIKHDGYRLITTVRLFTAALSVSG
jgi:hypothetical protein